MADTKLYISKVKLPGSSQVYYIKDSEARELISALGSPTHFAGVSSTEIVDGASTPTAVGGKDVHAGDIAVYSNKEFIWDGTKWVEFGDLSNLKDLAYHDIQDIEISVSLSTDEVLGSGTTFTNGTSSVTFASGAGSDFVTGYNNDGVAPSLGAASTSAFVTGYNNDGTNPSLGAATKSAFVTGYNDDAEAPSLGNATTGTFVTGYNNDAVAPSLGAATTGTFVTGYNNDAVAPSLGAATSSNFATQGVVAAMDSADTEMLVLSAASTSSAVTAQGTFSAGSPATLATASAVTAQGTFSAGSAATLATGSAVTAQGAFSAGSYPTLATAQAVTAQGTLTPGQLPTLATANAVTAQGTFNPGSAATLAKSKALTASDTGTAAAQTITVGSNDLVDAAVSATASADYAG